MRTTNKIIRPLVACLMLGLGALLSACADQSRLERTSSPEAMYERAQRAMRTGAYDRAIAYLSRLEIRYPLSEQARQSQLEKAYAYYRANQPEEAIDAVDTFITENPTHPSIDYAHYLKGLIYFEGDRNFLQKIFRVDLSERPPDDARLSFAAFSTLLQRFPASDYAGDARQRMVFLRNRLADYELHVAHYYLDRGAFVAAANRAKYVVENYQQAPAVREALQVMARAYNRLGLDDLAADARRVLRENFPNASRSERREERRELGRTEAGVGG